MKQKRVTYMRHKNKQLGACQQKEATRSTNHSDLKPAQYIQQTLIDELTKQNHEN